MAQSVHNIRKDGRAPLAMRACQVTYGVYTHADGSVLFNMGSTQVLVSVKAEKGVPPFLRGQGKGWLTAEYALLPASTASRTVRDSSLPRGHNGRSVEISRLIGRVFRSIIDLDQFGEYTIFIDCDVLNADGGTRCAAITGACFALKMAERTWLASRMICQPIMRDMLGAISVGICQGNILLDIDYQEDSSIDADYNFVMTASGQIIEIQGTSERTPISWEQVIRMQDIAARSIATLCSLASEHPADEPVAPTRSVPTKRSKSSGFTLGDRLGEQLEK